MTVKPKGHTAVMAQRHEPPDSLEFFPTPPWATRALCELVLEPGRLCRQTFWDPCCGEGHMSEVAGEYFRAGDASDVHDYGRGYGVGTFVGQGPDRAEWLRPFPPDWVIFNPPFSCALDFVHRALGEASEGVACFIRSAWAEGIERYQELFSVTPPSIEALFVERVPLVKGRWDPDASTATAYSWFVWDLRRDGPTRKFWIPPGQRRLLERADDRRRFASTEDNQEGFL